MALEVKLGQKLSQQLKLTTELKQAIRLLGLNQYELAKEVSEQLSENPVLESSNEDERIVVSTKDAPNDTEIAWYEGSSSGSYSSEREFDLFDFIGVTDENWREDLHQQVNVRNLKPNKKKLVNFLIENLDDHGYLTAADLELSAAAKCTETEITAANAVLRTLEPAGIGAKNIKDCLLLQLEQHNLKHSLAYDIVKNHLEDLAAQKFTKISKIYCCSTKEVAEIKQQLKELTPYPINLNDEVTPEAALPDLVLVKKQHGWEVKLTNNNLPNLSISEYYLFLLNNKVINNQDEKQFIKTKFKEANWLIQAILQRNNTILRVGEAIFAAQREHFLDPNARLKPLRLIDIANRVELHESTVSRAVSGKHITTPHGLIPLKHFFTNSVGTENTQSSNDIKKAIKALLAGENKKKPLSDQKIVELLASQDIIIARRTIGKYRNEMKVPGARQRKEF